MRNWLQPALAALETGLGLLLLITSLGHYLHIPERMYEMTFLSNALGGVLFLGDGVLRLLALGRRKTWGLPPLVLATETLALLVVVLITVGCTVTGYKNFGLTGSMAFLHVLNPILTVVWFLLSGLWECSERGEPWKKIVLPWKQVFFAPAFCMGYLVFDWLRSLRVGRYVYGLLPIGRMTLPLTLLAGLIAYAGLTLLAVLLAAGQRGIGWIGYAVLRKK